jgi:hypothetical protein
MRSRSLAAGLLFFGFLTIAAAAAPGAGWRTYASQELGYSISYPPDWRFAPNYIYAGFGPDHEIHGVAFQIPQSLTKGTNLSPNLTSLSMESVPGNTCKAARFIPNPSDRKTIREGGQTWSTATASEGAAGNYYETMVFALPGRSPCLAVRYSIHSTNIGNYDPDTVRSFDRAGLIKMFGAIRSTLRLRAIHGLRTP